MVPKHGSYRVSLIISGYKTAGLELGKALRLYMGRIVYTVFLEPDSERSVGMSDLPRKLMPARGWAFQ